MFSSDQSNIALFKKIKIFALVSSIICFGVSEFHSCSGGEKENYINVTDW